MRSSQCLLADSKVLATDFTEFLQQAGYINKESSGVYHYSTLGQLALQRLEQRVHEIMEQFDCCQWTMSLLQHQDNWDKTGRTEDYGDELMSVKLRNKQVMRLAATAEEQITNAVSRHLNGRSVNHWFYQINTKWRDEMRVRNGLVRAKEFRMLDAYSFDNSEELMMRRYENGKNALLEVLKSLGCTVRVVQSDCGEIGGLMSEEIQVQTTLEDDGWLEVGHCFALGQKYSQAFDFTNATKEYVWMSCHGLGTSRLLAVILNARKNGLQLLGDDNFSVVDDVLVCIGKNTQTHQKAQKLYETLRKRGRCVIWEDRFTRAGQALTVSEMFGARHRYVVSDRLEGDLVECLKFGQTAEVISV